MLSSRERLDLTLKHQQPDKIPFDLGSSSVTGIHVSSVYQIRQMLQLDPPGTPVKIIEPFMMLGEVKMDLIDALGIDVVMLRGEKNAFGFRNENWKPWQTFDSTPVLVPEKFNTTLEADGSLLLYPQGDTSAAPSGKMPAGGFYFDIIIRQPDLTTHPPRVEDNLEEFRPISDADLDYYASKADSLYKDTDKAILANFGGTGFGDIAKVPAPALKNPKGIRDTAEWYMSLVSRPEYIYKVFDRQCEIGLNNLKKIYEVVGNKVTAISLTGTDFGAQQGPFISLRTYRNLFKPFHTRINEWIHRNTTWKTFIHSCGSVRKFIPDFIEAGFDILNPVQTSAADMNLLSLKNDFGGMITFWGGGIDTQHTLPYGTPAEVRDEVIHNIRALAPSGGFVFTAVHNIQPNIPLENIKSFIQTFQEYRNYPLKK